MSEILKPDSVVDRERSEHNAKQLERRRIALALLPSLAVESGKDGKFHFEASVREALGYADELIEQTELKK